MSHKWSSDVAVELKWQWSLAVILICSMILPARAVAEVTGVSIDPVSYELTLGATETVELTAEFTTDGGDDTDTVIWQSSNTAVATVELVDAPDTSKARVTAISSGATVITVKTDTGNFSSFCLITVNPAAPLPKPLTKIDITPLTIDNLTAGDSYQLEVTLTPTDPDNPLITWSSSNTAAATVNSTTGLVTAVAAGDTTITATSQADASVSDSVTITVVAAPIAVTGIELDEKIIPNLATGGIEKVTATIKPDNATNKNIIWSSNDDDIAIVSGGFIEGVSVGTTVITATSEDGNKSASCVVTVVRSVTGVSLNQTQYELDKGAVYQLIATVSPVTATNQKCTWRSSNDSKVTVNAHGLITAVDYGEAVITVTTEDGGKIATCNVTVTAPEVTIPVTSISLDVKQVELEINQSHELTVTIEPTNATNKNVTFYTNNADIATVGSDGRITAVRLGIASITVVSADGAKTAACTVEVVEKTVSVTGVVVAPATVKSLPVDFSFELTALIAPSDATDQRVLWTSNDNTIARVSEKGVVTGIRAGSAIITATSYDGSKAGTCTVTVTNEYIISVTGVRVSPTSISDLVVDNIVQLTATVIPGNATNPTVIWSSNNENIVTVDQNGLVTAISPGSTTVLVETEDGEYIAACTIVVIEEPTLVTAVIISNDLLPDLDIDDSVQLTATVEPEDATNPELIWTSSNNQVATVDATGKVTALAEGNAFIFATNEDSGKFAVCLVTVVDLYVAVTGVSITPTTVPDLLMGETKLLTANVIPADATDQRVKWESVDTTVAMVDESGQITGVSVGTTTVFVTTIDGEKVAACSIRVVAKKIPVTGISLDKEVVTDLTVGTITQLIATVSPEDATNKNLIWVSNAESIATVSGAGIVTGLSPGIATITVTTVDGGFTNVCIVSVIEESSVGVTGVELDITEIKQLKIDQSVQITANVLPENATNKEVTWTSLDNAIVTVDSTGLVTGKAVGSTSVIVITTDKQKTAVCKITVVTDEIPVTQVSLDKHNLELVIEDTYQFTATVLPANATDKNVTWVSNNNQVATVSDNGLITAVDAGQAIITVQTTNGGFTDTCVVTVVLDETAREREVRAFVRRFYLLCLEREPDEPAWTVWTDKLISGESTGRDLSFGFVASAEMADRNLGNYAVCQVYYRSFFDREGDDAGLNAWINLLETGFPRYAEVADPATNLLDGFIFSAEFADLCARYNIVPY